MSSQHVIMPRMESAIQYIRSLGRNNKAIPEFTKFRWRTFWTDLTIATTPAKTEWFQNPGIHTGNHNKVNNLINGFFLCTAVRVYLWTKSAVTDKLELLDILMSSVINLQVEGRPKIDNEPTSLYAAGPGITFVSDAAAAAVTYAEAGDPKSPHPPQFWLYEPDQDIKAYWEPDTAVLGAGSVTAAMTARMVLCGWSSETPAAA